MEEGYETATETMADPGTKLAFELVEWAQSLEQHLSYYDEPSRKAFIAYYVDQAPLEQVAASLGLTRRQTAKKFESMRLYLKRHHKHLFVQLTILLSM